MTDRQSQIVFILNHTKSSKHLLFYFIDSVKKGFQGIYIFYTNLVYLHFYKTGLRKN